MVPDEPHPDDQVAYELHPSSSVAGYTERRLDPLPGVTGDPPRDRYR